MEPAPLGWSCERGNVPSSWEAPSPAGRPDVTGIFRGSEKSAATSLQAEQRPAWMALATLLHSPAWDVHLRVHTGTGC